MDNRLQTLVERSAEAWGVSVDVARTLMSLPRQKMVRINPLKAKKSTVKDIKNLGVELSPLGWCDNAYTVTNGYEKLSTSALFAEGLFILQDAASFVPTMALDPKPNDTILDICAAPGGKTTHIAALAKNKATIVANDTSRVRFFKMRDMFERMNVTAETTLYDGRLLLKQFSGRQFDKILLDAPCSGEAAMQPDNPKSYEQWSTAKIKRLSRLQEQLIVTAYDLLKPGGTLVYSTCTIAPEENELVIEHLLKRRPAIVAPVLVRPTDAKPGLVQWHGKALNPQIAATVRLLPSPEHEAFYTAKITKPLATVDDTDQYYG